MNSLKNIAYIFVMQMIVLVHLNELHASASEKINYNESNISVGNYKIHKFSFQKKVKGSFKGKANHITYTGYLFDELKFTDLIPEPSALKGVDELFLEDVLFVVCENPSKSDIKKGKIPADICKKPSNIKLTQKDLPPEIFKSFRSDRLVKWEDIPITQKVLLRANLNIEKNSLILKTLQNIGVTSKDLMVEASLSVDPIKLLKSRVKKDQNCTMQDFLTDFSFTIDIPSPKIPIISSQFQFSDTVLSLNSTLYTDEPWKSLPNELKTSYDRDVLNLFLSGGVRIKKAPHKPPMNALNQFEHSKNSNGITLITLSKGSWNDPFSIPKVSIDELGYKVNINKQNKDFNITIDSFGEMTFLGKRFDAMIDFTINSEKRDGEKLEFNYFEIETELHFSDIFGNYVDKLKLKDIDNKLFLHKILLQPTGLELEVDLTLRNETKKVSAYLFEQDEGINLAIELNSTVSIADLLSSSPKGMIESDLQDITIPKGMIFVSEKGIELSKSDTVKNPIISDIYSSLFLGKTTSGVIKLESGVGLVAVINAKEHIKGNAAKAMKKLKAEEDYLLLQGEIGGIFNNSFNLDLFFAFDLESKGIVPKKLSNVISGIDPNLHIKVIDDAISFGVGLGIKIKTDAEPVILDGELKVVLDDDPSIDIVGTMDNWKKPLGVPGTELNNFTMTFGVDASVDLIPGIGGKLTYLGQEAEFDGEIHLKPVMLGEVPTLIPTGIAFKADLNKLDKQTWLFIDDIGIVVALNVACISSVPIPIAGEAAMGICIGLLAQFSTIYDIIEHPSLTEKYLKDLVTLNISEALKDGIQMDLQPIVDLNKHFSSVPIIQSKFITMQSPVLKVATPGAETTNFGGISEGLAVSGQVKLFDTISLGSYTNFENSLSDTNKTKAKATNNLQATAPNSDNHAKSQNYLQDFSIGGLTFKKNLLRVKPFMKMASNVELFGLKEDVTLEFGKKLSFNSNTKLGDIGDTNLSFEYDKEHDDFTIIADLTSSIEPILKKEIKNGIDEIMTQAHLSSNTLKDDLTKATADVKKANDVVAQKLQKETDIIANDPNVRNLQNRLNSAVRYAENGVISYINSLCGDLPGKKCFLRHCYNAKAECKDGNQYLINRAKDAQNTLKESLQMAKNSVAIPKLISDEYNKAKKDLNDKLNYKAQIKALSDNLNSAGAYINNLKKDIDAKLSDNTVVVKEAILIGKVSDLKKGNALILEVKYTLNSKERTDYFGFKLNDAKYNAQALALLPIIVLDNFIKNEKSHEVKYLTNWLFALVDKELTKITSGIEKELASEESRYSDILNSYRNVKSTLLESSVDFKKEHGKTISKYTMTDMMPQSKVFENRYLAVGHSSLCLGVASNSVDVFQENCKDIKTEQWSAKSLENEYVQLKSKGLCLKAKNADAKNGQPLVLSQCNKSDDHELWKIISSDGFYDKIVNKFSQKCLHFDIENANPHTAFATWTSCLGMDSQTFRDISDAERPSHHDIEEMVEAKSGACLSTEKAFDKYFKKSEKGSLTTTKKVYDEMKRKGDDLLISSECKEDIEDKFNYVEMVDGDIKLVHAQSGWCVTPQSKNSEKLVLKPCNKNKNMFWRNVREGNTFEMKNMYVNRCMTLENSSKGKTFAKVANCSKEPDQLIQFIK